MTKPWEKFKSEEVIAPEAAPIAPAPVAVPKPWEKFTAEPAPELPVKQVEHEAVPRTLLKTLLPNSPSLQMEYLKKKGFKTREQNGQIQVMKPGEKSWSVVDPEGFDLKDVSDLIGDVAEAAVTGLGALFGSAVGPAGAVAGGAAATGAVEAGRQAVAKATGFREEFDPSQVGKSAAIGAVVPGALGVGKALAGPIVSAGQNAAGKALNLGRKQIEKLGPAGFKAVGEEARKSGLLNILQTKEGARKKGLDLVQDLGKKIESQYKALDSKVITRMPTEDVLGAISKVEGPLPAASAVKAVERTMKDLLSSKKGKDLKPSELWELAKKIDTKVGTYTKSTEVNAESNAKALMEVSKNLRAIVGRMAKARNMTSLAEDSKRFSRLKPAVDALEATWAASKTTKGSLPRGLSDIGLKVIGEVIGKGARAAAVPARALQAAGPKTTAVMSGAGTSIAERLKNLDE